MKRPLSTLLLFSTVLAPACAIYDAELLEQAVGGEGGSGSSENSGGQASGGGVIVGDGDGEMSTGGDSTGNGGNPDGSGGEGGEVGTGGTGGEGSGGDGAGGGSGGDIGVCSGSGTKNAYSFATNLIVDEFNELTRAVGGSTFDGNWVVASDGTGDDLLPQVDGALLEKEYDPCLAENDLSLHITGTGFTGYGASYDANLKLSADPVDLSDYTHIIVWARLGATQDQQSYYLSFTDETTTVNTTLKVATSKSWGNAHEFAIPAAIDEANIRVISIVLEGSNGSGDPVDFDIWFDDMMLVTK